MRRGLPELDGDIGSWSFWGRTGGPHEVCEKLLVLALVPEDGGLDAPPAHEPLGLDVAHDALDHVTVHRRVPAGGRSDAGLWRASAAGRDRACAVFGAQRT